MDIVTADELGLDAVSAQRSVEKRARLSEYLSGGDHVIAGPENREQRRRDRTHARAEEDPLLCSLEIGNELRSCRRRRVAEPPIERRRAVLEHLAMPNGRWRGVGRRENDRLAERLVRPVRANPNELRVESEGHVRGNRKRWVIPCVRHAAKLGDARPCCK